MEYFFISCIHKVIRKTVFNSKISSIVRCTNDSVAAVGKNLTVIKISFNRDCEVYYSFRLISIKCINQI